MLAEVLAQIVELAGQFVLRVVELLLEPIGLFDDAARFRRPASTQLITFRTA